MPYKTFLMLMEILQKVMRAFPQIMERKFIRFIKRSIVYTSGQFKCKEISIIPFFFFTICE